MKKNNHRPEREFHSAFFRENRLNFAVAAIVTMMTAAAMPFVSWMLGAITDAMTAMDMAKLKKIGLIVLIGLPFLSVVDYLSDRLSARFLHRAVSQYKNLAFRKISGKGISAFSKESSARYLSALTNDVTVIEQQYLEKLLPILYQCVSLAVGLGMMLFYSPVLTGVVLVGCSLPIVLSMILGPGFAKLEKRVSDRNEGFITRVKDLLSGFAVLKSFKAEGEAEELFRDANRQVEREKLSKRHYSAGMNSVLSLAGLTLQTGVFVVGAVMAIRGSITPGTVLIFVNLMNVIISPIERIPAFLAGRKAAFALIEKLAEVSQENTGRAGSCVEPILRNAIRVEDLTFGYEETKPVLKNVNITVEAGKKYALVGASGSGKSTLLNLLMGSYDSYKGKITVDERELRTVAPDSLYDLMSLIGQNVFLFDSTIRENITMFRSFPNDAVNSAAKRSGLSEVIAAKGEDYRCGENGVGLSGGERQRVSIARCLLRKTPVLMMDEATAALDNQTAFEVTDALLKLEGVTRIVVTHRLEANLLRQYDRIFVLRDGRIAEQGTYEELMRKNGYFYSLYNVSNP